MAFYWLIFLLEWLGFTRNIIPWKKCLFSQLVLNMKGFESYVNTYLFVKTYCQFECILYPVYWITRKSLYNLINVYSELKHWNILSSNWKQCPEIGFFFFCLYFSKSGKCVQEKLLKHNRFWFVNLIPNYTDFECDAKCLIV